MVVVNIISSAILLVGVLTYRYVYPKKKINLLLLLILISLLPLISILRKGDYESGDFNVHIYRAIVFFNALKEGQYMPSWAADLNATYGYPLFIFNYPLPYYVISFFHFLGFSFITSMKLFLATNFLLSGIFMYFCARRLLKNNLAAFVAAIFYQFAPYHLIDLHFKIVIGEIMIFTLLPLVFFFLQKLWEEKTGKWFILTSLSVALLIMSHVVLAFFAIVFLSCYAVFLSFSLKKKQVLLLALSTFISGSIPSLYIWLTPFFLAQYTIVSQYSGFSSFPQIWMLLFSPWRIGLLFQGSRGEISLLIGYAHILVAIILLFLLLRKKIVNKHKYHITFWLFAFISLIFFITQYSKLVWGMLPFLSSTGGSHRLLLLTAFASSILGGYLSIYLLKKKVFLLLLIGFTIFSTILNWGHRRVIPEISDQNLINNVWKSTSEGEGHWYANSKWKSKKQPWFAKLPSSHLEIIKGSAEIKELQRSSTIHTYILSAKTPTVLRENTLFFPGWQIFDNDTLIHIDHDAEGVIRFQLPKGIHYIEVTYKDVFVLRVLKKISVFGFLSLLGYLLFHFLTRFSMRAKLLKKT